MDELADSVDGENTIGSIGVYGLCCAYLGGMQFAREFEAVARAELEEVRKLVVAGYGGVKPRGDGNGDECVRSVDYAHIGRLRQMVCDDGVVDPDLDLIMWESSGNIGWCVCIKELCVCAMRQRKCVDAVCDRLEIARLDDAILKEVRRDVDDSSDDDDGVASIVARVQLSYSYMHELRVHDDVKEEYTALVREKMRHAIIAAAATTIGPDDALCVGQRGECTAKRVRANWVKMMRRKVCVMERETPAFDLAMCVVAGVGHCKDECNGCQWGRVQTAAAADLFRMCMTKKQDETSIFYLD